LLNKLQINEIKEKSTNLYNIYIRLASLCSKMLYHFTNFVTPLIGSGSVITSFGHIAMLTVRQYLVFTSILGCKFSTKQRIKALQYGVGFDRRVRA